MKTSLYTRATVHPVLAGALAAAGLAAAVTLLGGNFTWGKLKDAGVREPGPGEPVGAPQPAVASSAAAVTPKYPTESAIPQDHSADA